MLEIKPYKSKASKSLPFVVITAMLFMLSACTVAMHNIETSPSLETRLAEIKTIGVMPFTGIVPDIVAMSEWFAFNLNKQDQFNVISPALVEILARDNGLIIHLDSETQAGELAAVSPEPREINITTSNRQSKTITTRTFSTEDVQKIGLAIGADAMVEGSATYRTGLKVFFAFKLVDVVSGEIIASVQTTGKYPFSYSDKERSIEVMAMRFLSAISSSDSHETGGR